MFCTVEITESARTTDLLGFLLGNDEIFFYSGALGSLPALTIVDIRGTRPENTSLP